MAKNDNPKSAANSRSDKVGTYIAYGSEGEQIWTMDDFHIGVDRVPAGISMGMKAGRVFDTKSGDVISQWNPWGVV